MNRTLIALGVAATVALPVVAQAAPKVYGKLNLTVQNVDADVAPPAASADVWEVRSNASRFGVKGEDELTATLAAVYQIEWEVSGSGSADSAADLAARNRFVGLKSNSFGTLKLGRIDTYLKQAEGKVDLFNDLAGDIDKVVGAQGGPARANNVIDYSSPKFLEAVTVNVQLIQSEGVAAVGQAAANADNDLGDAVSASVAYSTDALYVAVAANKDVWTRFADNTGGAGVKADAVRVATSYTFQDLGLTLGALYQTVETSDLPTATADTEEEGWVVSAALKFADSWTAKLQHGESTLENAFTRNGGNTTLLNQGDVEIALSSAGLDYNFTKGTRAFGFYTLANRTDRPTDLDTTTYGLGIEHSF
jgi:predicted porin